MPIALLPSHAQMSGIYRITNLATSKLYIGSSCRLGIRKNEHWNDLRKNKHRNKHLQRAWNLVDETSFVFEILELCEKDELLSREQFYLTFYKATDHSIGYNISPDCIVANRGLKRTEEFKAKVSASKKGQRAGLKPANYQKFRETTYRPIDEYQNGTLVQQHESAASAGRLYGVDYKAINNLCRGRTLMCRSLPGKMFKYSDGKAARVNTSA